MSAVSMPSLSPAELGTARDRLRARTAQAPTDVTAWTSLAGVLSLLGQRVEAMEAWGRASALPGAGPEVHVEHARAATLIERWDVVIDALLRLQPAALRDAAQVWVASAMAAASARELSGTPRAEAARALAVTLRRRHVALRPHDVAAHADLGVMLLDLGEAHEACAAFARVAAMDPRFFEDNDAERDAYARAREELR